MTTLKRLALLGILIGSGCSSPPFPPPDRDDEARFRTIAVGMTREEVLRRVGPPNPRTERPDVWDYMLGGPRDPVYRFVFQADRVEVVKRFDGYAVVGPSSAED